MTAPSHTQDDDRLLDPFIEAARTPFPADAVDAATRRLRSRLPQPPRTRAPRVLRWAGAALTVLLALVVGPQLLPGSQGSAFAQVQAWFSSYRTVHIRTIMRHGGSVVSEFDIWSDHSGAARIEMDEMVLLVDPAQGALHTLMPGNRYMTQFIDMDADAPASMDWLHQIREFRGEATRLDSSRQVDGVAAEGHRLEVAGMTLTLWSDPADDRPLRVDGDLPGGLTMENVMVFDGPLPDDAFVVPQGYRPVASDPN